MHQRQIAARPLQTVPGAELQALGADIESPGMLACRHAPGQGAESQRLHIGTQPGLDILQRDIDQRAGDFSVADIGPGAQCALPTVQRDAERFQTGVLLDAGHIDAGKLAIHLAAPVQEIATAPRQQRLPEDRPQAEALAPFGRRRRVQPHQVALPAVAHHRVDLAQGQRRCRPHLVGPAQGAAAHDKFGLRKQPVGHCAVAGIGVFRQLQAADKDFAVCSAADIDFGPLDHQLLKAKSPQRGWGKRAQHLRQAHRFAPLRIEQNHVMQRKGRNRAQRFAGDAADAYRHAERPAGLGFQLRTEFGNTRHNPAVEYPPAQAKQQPGRDHQPKQAAHGHGDPSQTPGWQGGRGGRVDGDGLH